MARHQRRRSLKKPLGLALDDSLDCAGHGARQFAAREWLGEKRDSFRHTFRQFRIASGQEHFHSGKAMFRHGNEFRTSHSRHGVVSQQEVKTNLRLNPLAPFALRIWTLILEDTGVAPGSLCR